MDLNNNRIDAELAKEGVWVPLDDADLLIAQWLNANHREFIQKATQPHRRAMQMGTMSKEAEERIEVLGIAKTVLLDWRNLQDGGADIEYNEENAVRLLGDPDLVWFRDFVREQAQLLSNFKQEVTQEQIATVGKPSNGGSTGGNVETTS